MSLPRGAQPVEFTGADTFTWRGAQLPYLDEPYNTTILNDRAVEVPIARAWLAERVGRGLEVGNVLAHYQPVTHRVVDLYEQAPGVDNLDVRDLTDTYDWILAISTIEHVGWDGEPWDPWGAIDAVKRLRSLLVPGGELLITAPFGQNPYLDGAILSGGLSPDHFATMVFHPSGWVAHDHEAIWRPPRPRRWAGAVWVATWTG